MSSARPHRIDPASDAMPRAGRPLQREKSARPARVAAQMAVEQPAPTPAGSDSREQDSPGNWLSLHAGELVDRLQAWASDLDAREAQLNARTSLQDHRERQSRLRQQDQATELAEQRRAIERLREEMEAQARRIAFHCEGDDG